jgi:hypothetical protein
LCVAKFEGIGAGGGQAKMLGKNERGVLWDSNSNRVDVHSTKARQRHVELIIARMIRSREGEVSRAIL